MARILIWSPNYAPELTGISPLVTNAAEWLAARGHDVEVVAPFPNYPERRIHPDYRGALSRDERHGAVRVHRTWLRVRPRERFLDKLLYEASYATSSLPRVAARLRRVDTLVCVVPPLVAAAYGATLVRAVPHGPRFVLWVQDLVLTAATAVEGVGPLARRALRPAHAFERFAASAADRIVVCSPGFGRYLAGLGVPEEKIATVYNGVDAQAIDARPQREDGGPTRFLYIGNLGYTQDFATIVAAARELGPEAVVDVYGAGNAAQEVEELARPVANVHLHAPVPWDRLPDLLAGADVHLLAQKRAISEANLPSKIGPCLASGRPLLAAVDLDSPAADLLRESGGAVVVAPESPPEFAEAMRRLGGDPGRRAALGASGRAFAERVLAHDVVHAQLEAEFLGP